MKKPNTYQYSMDPRDPIQTFSKPVSILVFQNFDFNPYSDIHKIAGAVSKLGFDSCLSIMQKLNPATICNSDMGFQNH